MIISVNAQVTPEKVWVLEDVRSQSSADERVAKPLRETVTATMSLRDQCTLRVDFEVRRESAQAGWMTLPKHSTSDEPIWGLWDGDVVEVFIQAPDFDAELNPHYFEFQVAPNGSFFELEIFQPRVSLNRNFRSGFRKGVSRLESDLWQSWMEIDLTSLGWKNVPSALLGGVFSILGPTEDRGYYSAFIRGQSVPDFHLPKLFQVMLQTGVDIQ
jgi:hypothetical protein